MILHPGIVLSATLVRICVTMVSCSILGVRIYPGYESLLDSYLVKVRLARTEYIYTVYDRMFGGFSAKIAVHT